MSETENTPISLTLVDLHNAVLIIDAASERGAFKGPELSSVGAVRDKIAAIVQEHSPKENTDISTEEEVLSGGDEEEEVVEQVIQKEVKKPRKSSAKSSTKKAKK